MREPRDERGGAMIAVVLVSMVASLLAMAALATASGSLRSSAAARSAERALHLAEAAASRALSIVTASPGFSNAPAAASPTEDDIVAAAAGLAVEGAPGGEMAWVVPDGSGVAYGIGYVPARADAEVVRVAAVRYEVEEAAVTFAVLTEGDLTIAGTATVSGLGGSVHANGDLTIAGTASVAGDASAAGSATSAGDSTVDGETTSDAAAQVLPAVEPAAYRELTDYDLCPDATVRTTSEAVCAGSIVGNGLATQLVGLVPTLVGWNGWTFDVLTGWTMSRSTTIDGGFYVHGANARVTGSAGTASDPWLATIVVGGTEVGGVLSTGDLAISSNAVVRPWSDGVLAVADRDVSVGGSSYDLEGLVMAGEQVAISGNGSLTGQVVAAGSEDTTGSPVAANAVTDVELEAEFGAPISVGGVSVTRWSEL